MDLNIYLVKDNSIPDSMRGYYTNDRYDSLVVVAENAGEAFRLFVDSTWKEPVVEYLGIACPELKKGVVLGSMNSTG